MSRGRALHPALKARAAAVKIAHAHLSKTVPGFRDQPGHEQLRQTQAHVSKMAANTQPKMPGPPGGY